MVHRVEDRFLHKLYALVPRHPLAIVFLHEAVDVRAARPADRDALPDLHTTDRDRVHLAAVLGVPPGHDDAGDERIAVVVAVLPELVRSVLDQRRFAGLVPVT